MSRFATAKAGSRFLGRLESGFDANVKLLIAALEPATAASAEGSGLLNFVQTEEQTVEFAGGVLAAFWRGNLGVVNSRDNGIHLP